jgi:MEDS: MEthanogen/methylotroph, DcmR Sensory domain
MPSGSRQATPVGVDRLQPGDHAFLSFSDDAERWDILRIFTQQGLARDERVFLSVATERPPAEVAARAAGGTSAARGALSSGQLVVSDPPRLHPGAFDASQFVAASRERLGAASADGFVGVRIANELSPAPAPFDTLDQVVTFEKAVDETLAESAGVRYTALCNWDERRFGDGTVIDAVRAIHPVTILPTPGALHVARTVSGGIRVTGDSDLSTRGEFVTALRLLENPGARTGPPAQELVIDISDLSFLDAYSAGAVLRLAAGLSPPCRLQVRCRAHHRRLLYVLGGKSVRQLSIVTDRLT